MKAALAVVAAAVAACAPSAPLAPQRGYAAALSCIPISQISGRYVLPPAAVVFEVGGPTNYRNDLASACPGLERLGRSAVVELADASGDQLCSGDRIRVYDPVEAKATGRLSYPTCILGDFEPIPRG